MPWFINRYTVGGLLTIAVVLAIFWAGDKYGWNARQYAACKAETARRNAAVAGANALEEARHGAEEAKRAAARAQFARCPGIQQCILTPETAACLNLIGDAP
jgi:hypothetical protein